MANPREREQALFVLGLTKSAHERQAFLDRECAHSPELRARLEALFAAHDHSSPLDAIPDAARRTMKVEFSNKPVDDLIGQTIGPYKLLQRIGEGGCGVVYMAEQEKPVRRRVALKVIKMGMDTKQVIARFEAERQALAMMDHPNIAKVLDAGATETGRPYFVMELVRGIKITDYCDQNHLAMKERLNIFTQICRAIQHAHQKGIIHRDIKPSNILVTLHDGVAVPKVIDFGIAKATQGPLTNQTLFTPFEQFIGTPAYMSPEQAEMSGLDVDTRTDVYSLGVLLYELLVGRTPFDIRELLAVGLDALRRAIREKEPPKPSTCLSTMAADALTSVAAHRQTEAPKLIHIIRGDLDWIVMKALEKDRTRRYETANGLAMDVERFLNDEPIAARPPSKIYHFQKLVRRNKTISLAAAATSLALLVGIMVSTIQAARASRAEKLATQERNSATRAKHRAEALNRFLQDEILFQGTPATDAPESIQILMRQALERAAKKLDQPEVVSDPELEANLRLAVGESYRWLSVAEAAETHIRRAVNLRRTALGANAYETLLAEKALVCLLSFDTPQWDEEIEKLSFVTWQKLKSLAEAKPEEPSDKELWRATLDTEAAYIWELAKHGEIEKAIKLKEENVASYERILGPEDADSIKSLQDLGVNLESFGRYSEAEATYRRAIERYTRIGKGDTYPALRSQSNLAICLFLLGDSADAQSVLSNALFHASRIFSAEHILKLEMQLRLARVLAENGKWQEAEDLARENLEIRLRFRPANDGWTAYTMVVLGRILIERGNLDEAQARLEEARRIFLEYFSGASRLAAAAENWLGAVHLARKDYVEAERYLLPLSEQFLLPTILMSPQERRICLGHIVSLYTATGKPGLAASWQREIDAINKPQPAAQ